MLKKVYWYGYEFVNYIWVLWLIFVKCFIEDKIMLLSLKLDLSYFINFFLFDYVNYMYF